MLPTTPSEMLPTTPRQWWVRRVAGPAFAMLIPPILVSPGVAHRSRSHRHGRPGILYYTFEVAVPIS